MNIGFSVLICTLLKAPYYFNDLTHVSYTGAKVFTRKLKNRLYKQKIKFKLCQSVKSMKLRSSFWIILKSFSINTSITSLGFGKFYHSKRGPVTLTRVKQLFTITCLVILFSGCSSFRGQLYPDVI